MMHSHLLHLGPVTLPIFGLLLTGGLLLAMLLSLRTARWAGLPEDRVWDAGILLISTAFVVSRALLIVQNFKAFAAAPVLLFVAPSLGPAGLLITVAVAALVLRSRRLPLPRLLDAWAPCATLLWAFLATGHWVEGSDPGLALPPGSGRAVTSHATYPVALYAACAAATLTALLLLWLRRGATQPGRVGAAGLILAGLAQYGISFVREPGLPGWWGLDQLQVVALAMVAAGMAFAAWPLVKVPRVS